MSQTIKVFLLKNKQGQFLSKPGKFSRYWLSVDDTLNQKVGKRIQKDIEIWTSKNGPIACAAQMKVPVEDYEVVEQVINL